MGRVLNFRSGHLHAAHLWCSQLKLPNLKVENSAWTNFRFSPDRHSAPMTCGFNGTAHLYVIQTEAQRGKQGKQNKFSRTKYWSYRDIFTVLIFMQSSKCYYVW